MAVSYIAARPVTFGGHTYAAGDTVDTTGWASNTLSVMIRLGWVTVSVGGGASLPINESDVTNLINDLSSELKRSIAMTVFFGG